MTMTFYLVSFGNSDEERFDVLATSTRAHSIGVLLDHYRKRYSTFSFAFYLCCSPDVMAYRVDLVYDEDLDLYSTGNMKKSNTFVSYLKEKAYEK